MGIDWKLINEKNDIITKQQIENNELKAMVNGLSSAAMHVINNLSNNGKAYTLKQEDLNVLQEAHALTPAQCLANIKADAVEEFASVLCSPKCGFEYRLSDAAKVYADKLRKTMITTSSESSLSEVVNKINEEL